MKAYLYPTRVKIVGYSEDEENAKKMIKYYSVYDKYKFKYTFTACVKDEENDTLTFFGAISTNTIKYYFPNIKIIDRKDKYTDYKTVNKYLMLKPPRDDIQKDAIRFLKRKFPQKFLSLQTGMGKSYCAINYCHFCKKLPIIIVDQESLYLQWKSYIMDYTSCRENEIFLIKGVSSINKLFKMKERDRDKIKFFIAIHKTMQTLYDKGVLSDFFKEAKIGLKIYDEAHFYYKTIFYVDSCTDVETIYLSATPERTAENEQKLYERMFYMIQMHKTELSEKYYNVGIYNINMNYTDLELSKMYNKRGFDVLSYCKSITDDKRIERFETILIDIMNTIFSKNFNRHKKVAITVKLIEQTELVKDIIDEFLNKDSNEKGYERILTTAIFNGKTKKEDKLRIRNEVDIIITTDKSFSKGMDVKDLEILINFVPVSCKTGTSNINQITGRLRKLDDKKVFYIDVVENSIKSLVSMYRTRLKYYKTIAKKIYFFYGYGCKKKGK